MHKATPDFAPFSFYIEAVDHTDYISGPRYIHVHVDQAFIDKLARRHAFCEAENLTKCLEDCSPFAWDRAPHSPDGIDRGVRRGDEPARVEDWQLLVDKDSFKFIGADDEVVTVSRAVHSADLGLWLHGAPADSQSAVESDGYRRIGSILLYAEYDMDEFVDTLTRCRPEVAAAIVEDEMAQQIATSLEAGESPPNAAADASRVSQARTRKTRI